MPTTQPTTQSTADRFYAIFRPLLFYVNTRLLIVPGVQDAAAIAQMPVAEVNKIRQAMWNDDSLRGDFIEQNPANLSGDDLMIAASWNNRRAGKFFVFRHLKPHSIFIDDRSPVKVYAVHGLVNPLAAVVGPYLPVLTEVVLLPFEDQIIYDSIMEPYNITFGGGIRSRLNDLYRDAKERSAIITSLRPAAGALNREDQSATVQTINAKVLSEFRAHLYQTGLSAKIVERDILAVDTFANTYLANLIEPRSVRDLASSDLTTYLIGAPTALITGFKRFVKFMSETGRLDGGEADEVMRWLRAR